jgi:hypothetical protein
MSTPAPAAPAKKTAKTIYVVLRELDPTEPRAPGWILHNESCRAASAEAAIRLSIADENPGTYVAIPSRSWKPIKVTVTRQTVIKLGGSVA